MPLQGRGNEPRAFRGQRPISVNLRIDRRSICSYYAGMPQFVKEAAIDFDNWAILRTFLPPGWEDMARSSGALRRVRDFPNAEALLRVLLLHVANGCSLAETATRARELGIQVSAVAVFKRLRASEQWLRWLAEHVRSVQRQPLESQGRPVRAVDGTSVSEPGSTGTDWRVHYVVNLADLQCDFFELTGVKEGGETLRRVPIRPGDIMMGDRVYASPVGVAHVVKAKADLVVRLNRQALPLFDGKPERVNVLRLFRPLKVGQVRQWTTQVRHPQGGWIPGRLIALRRSLQATRVEQRRLELRACRKQQQVSAESWEAARYFSVWTTLADTFSAVAVLELYRWRWQIELAIKRMKSIVGLGHLPKKDPASARAWLHGKLFTSLLVERLVQAANSFSPWGYRLGVVEAKPLAGN